MSESYGIEEARKILGDLATAAQYGHSTTLTKNGKPIARIVPIEESSMDTANTVIWSVVRGTSPAARAVEPGPAGVDIPDDVLTWAEGHGVDIADPDVYVLVTPADEAGQVDGEVAYRKGEVSAEDMAAIREALDG